MAQGEARHEHGDKEASTRRAEPYAAPAETPADDSGTLGRPGQHRLATINQRFAAHFVDILVFVLPPFALSVSLGADALALDGTGTRFITLVGVTALVPASGAVVLDRELRADDRKRVFKTRIVRVDGSPAGFLHGVVLRSWVGCLPLRSSRSRATRT